MYIGMLLVFFSLYLPSLDVIILLSSPWEKFMSIDGSYFFQSFVHVDFMLLEVFSVSVLLESNAPQFPILTSEVGHNSSFT